MKKSSPLFAFWGTLCLILVIFCLANKSITFFPTALAEKEGEDGQDSRGAGSNSAGNAGGNTGGASSGVGGYGVSQTGNTVSVTDRVNKTKTDFHDFNGDGDTNDPNEQTKSSIADDDHDFTSPTPGSTINMTLRTNKSKVYRGQPVQLSWTTDAQSCYTTGGFGGWAKGQSQSSAFAAFTSVNALMSKSGTQAYVASRVGTSVFTYTCQSRVREGAGEGPDSGKGYRLDTASLRRSVEVLEPLPTCTLLVDRTAITEGQPVTITWRSSNAVGKSIISQPRTNIAWEVYPNNSDGSRTHTLPTAGAYTYTMIVKNAANQSARCTRTVTVQKAPAAPLLTGTNCTIPSGRSYCPTTLAWNITNAANPNIRNATRAVIYANSARATNFTGYITNGRNLIQARNGTTVLATTSVTGVCATGTLWNGTACANNSATISGTNCTIAAGASLCQSSLNWNIKNATNPIVYNVTRALRYATVPTGTNVKQAITYGRNLIQARNGTSVLEFAEVIARCATGFSWNSRICAPTVTANATISGTNCIIAAGASLCQSSLTWDIINATRANVYNQTTAISYSTASRGTRVNQSVTYGRNLIQARNNTTVLATTSVSATCAAGSAWQSGRCVSGATTTATTITVELTADSNMARVDDQVTINWEISDLTGATCTLTGPNLSATSISVTTESGSVLTRPISNQSTYTLSCDVSGSTVADTTTVEVVPKAQEV